MINILIYTYIYTHFLVKINNEQRNAQYVHKNRKITGFFFENRLHWQSEKRGKLETTIVGRIFVYVQMKH
jgi:hypothetical protein